MNKSIEEIASLLHSERCSCVIYSRGKVILCRDRGVKDLLRLLKEDSSTLTGALVADKVIGKGAAALMILGGVKSIYTDVISKPALELLSTVSIQVQYGQCVPNIMNRACTGVCPVETLCMDCVSAIDCLPLIEKFFKSINKS